MIVGQTEILLLFHISLCLRLSQITHFNSEMAKLLENVKTMQRNCCLEDDNNDLASFRKRTEATSSKLAEIKSITKVCHYICACNLLLLTEGVLSFVFGVVIADC